MTSHESPPEHLAEPAAVTAARYAALILFCIAAILLIPLGIYIPGGIAWLAGAAVCAAVPSASFRRRMWVLFAVIAIMAVSPIHTGLDTLHFFTLAVPFATVLFGPTIFLRLSGDHEAIDWRFWPRRFSWLDLFYTAVSVPIALVVLKWYFYDATPDMPTHWLQPPEYDREQATRLIIGINAVGIWDELFFINTVYGILRTIFPRHWANLAQAVIYTSMLNKMAFTGVGPIVVYLFALTQGFMYEKSRCLLYVLIVHIVVDFFLVIAILHHYYPHLSPGWF